MKVKGYKPTKKCIQYMKKMISQGTWVLNEKIPTIRKITEVLGVSYSTVRNAMISFEREGILENYGSLGFFLKSRDPVGRFTPSISLIKKAKLNLNASEMLRVGAIKLNHWIIQFNKESRKLTALNLISGAKISCIYEIIQDILQNPITLQQLLSISNPKEYKKQKAKYNRQTKLLPLAKIILHYKKDLLS